MPNWCHNELYISGRIEDIKKFVEHAKGENDVLDFNKFIPYPKKYAKADKERQDYIDANGSYNKAPQDGYNQGGYEWCRDNWGTKWNACEVSTLEDLESGYLEYNFDTAWTPPTPIILAMSKAFPKLYFRMKYQEECIGFMGKFYCENGKVTKDVSCE